MKFDVVWEKIKPVEIDTVEYVERHDDDGSEEVRHALSIEIYVRRALWWVAVGLAVAVLASL